LRDSLLEGNGFELLVRGRGEFDRRPFSRARLPGRAGDGRSGYGGSARLSCELPKRPTVIPNHGWIVWPNSCATRGRRAAAGSASLAVVRFAILLMGIAGLISIMRVPLAELTTGSSPLAQFALRVAGNDHHMSRGEFSDSEEAS
jgi:hypothetical protein